MMQKSADMGGKQTRPWTEFKQKEGNKYLDFEQTHACQNVSSSSTGTMSYLSLCSQHIIGRQCLLSNGQQLHGRISQQLLSPRYVPYAPPYALHTVTHSILTLSLGEHTLPQITRLTEPALSLSAIMSHWQIDHQRMLKLLWDHGLEKLCSDSKQKGDLQVIF